MGETVRVETSCPRCGLGGLRDEPWDFAVKPGSLTAARLRLADAAEAWHKAARAQTRNGQPDPVLDKAWADLQQECEALRGARGAATKRGESC